MKIFCNGALVEKDTLSEVFEPGFLFGWGVFETLRAYQGKVPFLDSHIRRLNKGLSLLSIDAAQCDFKNTIGELLTINSLKDAYVRITAYKKRESTGVIIYVDKFGYYSASAYEKGFTGILSPYRRNAKNIFSQIKSLSYLENRMSWHWAQSADKDEALVLNEEGFLAGGARSNLFIVKDNEVITPSKACGALSGITRAVIIEALSTLKIPVKEQSVSADALFFCDEAFLTSSLLEVMPLVEYENKIIGNGKVGTITSTVLEKYRNLL
jgi:branched-chain amino acid aminotransferase